MPQITLSTFLEFILKPGPRRPAWIRAERKRQTMQPPVDYYKEIRERIAALTPTTPPDELARRLLETAEAQPDVHQRGHFREVAEGFARWRRRYRDAQWTTPPVCDWTHESLTVRVHPELGAVLDGVPHLIKLYFLRTRMYKPRSDVITRLLSEACVHCAPPGGVMAALDVRRPLLVTAFDGDAAEMSLILRTEADYFLRLWRELPE